MLALALLAMFLPAPQQQSEPISACARLQHADTHYVLQQDVQSPGTCFSIEADDITLDLNGHAATYATEEKDHPTFGVLAADCWYQPAAAGNPCGGTHAHITVMNGSIVQGEAAAPFSHGLRFGQANGLTGVVLHDLTIRIHAEDSIAIFSEYLPGGSEIYSNTIDNEVKTISNRMQFRGASIKLDNEDKATMPDDIHDNVIKGGPQLGIRSDNPAGTKIRNNDISQDATYANGFCIDAAGDGMQVTGNNCHPVHGRGLHANHSHVVIDSNTVTTVDSNQIAEYNGCEIHGTYGIQIEDDENHPTDITVTNNKVTVYARECDAEAMRITDLQGAKVNIHGNSFTAVEELSGSGPKSARGISIGGADGQGATISHNTFHADSAIFHVDWDGGSNWTLNDNTFQGNPAKHTLMAEFENGAKPSSQIHFLDDTYTAVNPEAAKFGAEAGATGYSVERTFVFHSDPPRELHGSAASVPGGVVLPGKTGPAGSLVFTLPALEVQNGKPIEKFAAYKLNVSAPGCQPLSLSIRADGPRSLARPLVCR